MSDLINNSDFFSFHGNQQNLKDSNHLDKSVDWASLYGDGKQTFNSNTHIDGNHSPSTFLNLGNTPILNSQNIPQLNYDHNLSSSGSNGSNGGGNISYVVDENCTNYYVSPIGSPVPSYYSNQSSPQQDNYSPQSPTVANNRNTNTNNQNMNPTGTTNNTTTPVYNGQNGHQQNNLIHPDNFNLVLNFIPQQPIQQQQQQQLPSLFSYQQPIQHVQQHKSKQQKVQHQHIPQHIVHQQQQQQQQHQHHVHHQQQDYSSVLNLAYQPGLSNISLQNETLEEFIDKPFSEESFLNSIKSVIPGFKDIDNNLLSSSMSDNSSPESDSDSGRPNRKRVRDENGIPEDIDTSGSSILPRDKVLKLTSKEIEEYVGRLKQNHVLSQSEEKELKRQRRLIKNREYASQSRSRRKQYVETIEQKLQRTNQENMSIKEENKVLKKQLFAFSATLKNNPSLAELFGKIFQPTGKSSTKAAASLSLFVFFLLFTFTFFLPTQLNSPFSVAHPEKSFLQRNLLNYEPFENISPLNVIYEKSVQMKNLVYEQGKEYIEKMFGSLAVENSKEEVDKLMKDLTIENKDEKIEIENENENENEIQQPVIVNPPKISNAKSSEKRISLKSDSPPLSPLNVSDE